MSLRNPQALLGTLQRAGVLCLASGGRTCIAHGLPSTPDSITFSHTNLATATYGAFLESWDSTYLSFLNSLQGTTPLAIYIRVAVEHSIIQ